MSPRLKVLLTLAGILLVGLPLPILTRSAEAPVHISSDTNEAEQKIVYATLRFTGQPVAVKLRQPGGEWEDMDTAAADQDFELNLPLNGRIEIELDARWENTEPQAVTLMLEPDGYEVRQETQWKNQGSQQLHSLFSFTW